MSSRSLSKNRLLSVVSALAFGFGFCPAAQAANAPVQTYVDQAVPEQPPQADQYYNSPLSAGTLTLQDVLEAHRPATPPPALPDINATPSATATAPLLTPPAQSSATGLMMSQGMKDVLQHVGTANLPPVKVRQPAAQGQPVSLTPPVMPATASVPAAPAAKPVAATVTESKPVTVNGVTYQPGEEPHNLGASSAPSSASTAPTPATPAAAPAASAPAPAAAASGESCDQHVQKWEKSCSDAGYPSAFVGKIVGETRTGCADGQLHDVWVSNTCAPPDMSAQTAKADGACGQASDNEYDSAPATSLCSAGIASAVSGDGPWTWACSGVNGGNAVACAAQKRVLPVNGACGSANGVAVSSAPSSDLCDAGTASAVNGSGPWTWSCHGIGAGSTQSCIAPSLEAPAAAAPAPAPAPVEQAKPVATTPSAPAAAKTDLCGPAAETLAYQAPDKDLCRDGSASVVNGDGPWTWSCTTNEGVTSNCRTMTLSGDTNAVPAAAAPEEKPAAAPEAAVESKPEATPDAKPEAAVSAPAAAAKPAVAAPVPAPAPELACGLASSQGAVQSPTSNLCEGGKASIVRGSNPWRWTCRKGHKRISCETPKMVAGSCGEANGATLQSAPFSGLCSSGAPSALSGDGPWTWTCAGSNGGTTVSCAAALSKPEKTDGACGSANGMNAAEAPTDNLCATGKPSEVSGTGPWSWACSGANGGAVASCSADKLAPPKPPGPKVNGLCGSANGVMTGSQPSGDDLCSAGTVSGPVGNGPWNWSCIGFNGGMTVSCTAPLQPPAPIDGACGDANGVSTLVKPQSGLCAAGITGAVNGEGPWTWTCSGVNGGAAASCVAPLAGKTASVPSVMTEEGDNAGTANPAPAPAGLVTPQLPSSDELQSLNHRTLPSLTPSASLKTPPAPSAVPSPATVAGDEVEPEPELPADAQPLQPPSLSKNIPSAPVLQESAATQHIPGNHLVLDPTISTIIFMHGSSNIDQAVVPALNKLSIVLQNNPDARISLLAYADNTGSTPRDARRLSLKRALAIKEYLSSKGISESRVDVHAEGANTTTGYIDRVDIKVND